jgi:hypothetical protein
VFKSLVFSGFAAVMLSFGQPGAMLGSMTLLVPSCRPLARNCGTMVFTERYAQVGNIGEFGFRIARDLAATIMRAPILASHPPNP